MKKNSSVLILIFFFMASSMVFSQSITVTNPNLNSNWCIGNTYNITWNKSGNLAPKVKVNIFKGSIAQANFIEQLTGDNSGTIEWEIKSSLYTQGSYILRIKEDKEGVVVYGDSVVFSLKKCMTSFNPNINKTILKTKPVLIDLPDFEVYGKQLGFVGCNIEFHVAVKNRGNKDAGTVPVRLNITGPSGSPYSNYTLNSTLPCPTLQQNMTCDWTRTFTIKKSGLYRFKFTVNPEMTIRESKFGNNSSEEVISVQKPDLIVWISPPSKAYLAFKSTTVFYVKNQGRGCADPSKLRTYMKQKGVKLHSIPTLRHNEIYKITRTEKWFTLGTKKITAFADYDPQKVDELNENNNSYQTSVRVKAATTTFDQSGLAPPPAGFFENARVINK